MATRSVISRQNADGTFSAIYCHWDGSPDTNGRMLVEHYTDSAKVDALLALGSISALGEEIGEKVSWESAREWTGSPQCLAYHRDRGEPWEDVRTRRYSNLGDLMDFGLCSDGEYIYAFINGEWKVRGERGWMDIEEVIQIEQRRQMGVDYLYIYEDGSWDWIDDVA